MASLTYELTLAGLAVGSAAALTGIGLIVTHRATGVLNLAHGALAMVCAYVLRQLVVVWGWPLWPAALLTLLLVAPGLGLLLDRAVFRPLARSGAGPARALVASTGVFVLLVGVAVLLWGAGARDDAPVLLGDEPWLQLATVVAVACLVTAVTRWTRFGRELRAVVDNRPLAVLAGVDADRIAAAGWAFGAFTAGLTGVLLAPYVRLDPYGLPLLVVEVMAVAVIARMRSLPVAIGAALLIGVTQAQLTRFHPEGWAEPLLRSVGANLFVLALLIAALVLPGIGGKGHDALPPPPRAARTPPAIWPLAAVCFLLPLAVGGPDLRTATQVPALAIVLLSLVVVTGRAGQIALGQAAYAGLGALFTTLFTTAGVPPLPALALAVPLTGAAGLLTAGPAIRRHGLALALATLAVGVAVSRFVLAQPYATAGLAAPVRPWPFTSDRAFYALGLLLLTAALLLVGALRRGRTGRALAALRDHEPAAEAAGVPATPLKLLAFALAAALAGLGGALLAMAVEAFDPTAYDPLRGLLWFATVMVLGADNLLTPLLAAPLLLTADTATPAAAAALAVGLLATQTGRLPPLTALLSLPRATGAVPARGPTPPAGGREPPPGRPAAAGPHPGTGDPGAGDPGTGDPGAGDPAPPARAGPPARLRAEGLWFAHPGGVTALRGVGLVLPTAQVTALVGPNGAGKSTLFDCLAGAARPRPGGRVLLDGRDITHRPARTRAHLGIARTFQRPALFPSLSVEENVRVGAEHGHHRDHPATATERALRLTGLAGPVRLRRTAGLPTGLLRRVELARALAGRPHTLLLDEPAAGLDAAEAEALSRLLTALAADGLTVLVVEHDPDLVAGTAATVHTMEGGRLRP
ncbi:ATP-binding cassette domain-containing protein [Streptomyces sp. NPDC056503]|uniref:ABC transporter permease subunit n=1 Tax=Streptomyces sp. NPDC056503 TaxID=3345842 RepID=UPI0036C8838B